MVSDATPTPNGGCQRPSSESEERRRAPGRPRTVLASTSGTGHRVTFSVDLTRSINRRRRLGTAPAQRVAMTCPGWGDSCPSHPHGCWAPCDVCFCRVQDRSGTRGPGVAWRVICEQTTVVVGRTVGRNDGTHCQHPKKRKGARVFTESLDFFFFLNGSNNLRAHLRHATFFFPFWNSRMCRVKTTVGCRPR